MKRPAVIVSAAFAIVLLATAMLLWFFGKPEKAPAPIQANTDTPLDWPAEFRDINWQAMVTGKLCSDEPHYQRSLPMGGCDGDGRRPITASEKAFYDLVSRVAQNVAPPGYVLWSNQLGGGRDMGDVWIEDLDGNGVQEMSFFFVPTSSIVAYGRGYRDDTSRDILLIVAPTDREGGSREIVRVSSKEFSAHFPSSSVVELAPIEGTEDFDHDGKKELAFWAGFNEPLNLLWRVNYNKGTLEPLKVRNSQGALSPFFLLGYQGGFGLVPGSTYNQSLYFQDLNNDGVDEYVSVMTDFDPKGNAKVKSLEVYEWNGSLFDFSSSLSEQLATSTFNNTP